MASDAAIPTLHSPCRGVESETSAAALAAIHSPQGGVLSSPWTNIVIFSAIQKAAAFSPLLSPPPVYSGAEEKAVSGLSTDQSPTDTRFSTSILPDEAAGDTQPEGSGNGSGGRSNGGKKPVWNKACNGGAEIGSAMGAESWPSLSESIRASKKLSSTDFPKAMPSAPQADVLNLTGVVLRSSNSTSTPHHYHNRPRPFKSSNYGVAETNRGSAGRLAHNLSGGNTRNGGQRPQQQQNSFGQGNHGYGGNRDSNPNGRDIGRVQQHIRGPTPTLRRPFFRPPPMPVRPIVNYPHFSPRPHAFTAPSVVPPHKQPVSLHDPDPQQQVKILTQIEYYFSTENLIKDTYLRQHMDDQGWVPVEVISDFKIIKELNVNIQMMLDYVKNSSAVEVEGEKVRKRNDWEKWLLPSNFQHAMVSSHRYF